MSTQEKFEKTIFWVFLLLAASCLFFPLLDAELFYYVVAVCVTLSAIALTLVAFKRRKGMDYCVAAAALGMCLMLWIHHHEADELIMFFFAFYMLFNAVCEGIQWYLDCKDNTRPFWTTGLLTLVYLALAIGAYVFRKEATEVVMRFFGLYLLVQAVQLGLELFYFKHVKSTRSYALDRWISLPVYIVSFLPGIVLKYWLGKNMKTNREHFDQHKNDEPVNLRVYIHTGLSGEHLVGHMTFSYQGIMYSYGNYDTAQETLHRTIGPGIFFSVPAEIYVNNSCVYENSTIFEYGLHISPQQEQKLQEVIRSIFMQTYRWYCPLEKQDDGRLHFESLEQDYANRLFYRTGAKYRKFYSGKWKTYWVLGDNCSLFAEDVLSQIGCHIVHKSGIVSPGEYFEFFETAYADPKSNVVYRSWHDASVPSTLFATLA